MRIDVLTLFPQMFRGPFDESILKRAAQANLLSVKVHDIREHTTDRHHTADDAPFGGGAGQVLKAPPIIATIDQVVSEGRAEGRGNPSIILMAAQGRRFTQPVAEKLAQQSHLILICGHYEGIDDRVRDVVATDTISIGDYVVTGGELPAMVVVDAVARLIPGVLGASESLSEESMTGGLLEYPQFTRPAVVGGRAVPPVLLSGDHAAIARWRRDQALRLTFRERPDLLVAARLDRADADVLSSSVQLPDSVDATT
jgi:tRNA (guanine37-N1)-methyltransferase